MAPSRACRCLLQVRRGRGGTIRCRGAMKELWGAEKSVGLKRDTKVMKGEATRWGFPGGQRGLMSVRRARRGCVLEMRFGGGCVETKALGGRGDMPTVRRITWGPAGAADCWLKLASLHCGDAPCPASARSTAQQWRLRQDGTGGAEGGQAGHGWSSSAFGCRSSRGPQRRAEAGALHNAERTQASAERRSAGGRRLPVLPQVRPTATLPHFAIAWDHPGSVCLLTDRLQCDELVIKRRWFSG